MEDTLQKAVDYIKTKIDIVPRIGLVLGSGLGDAADIRESRSKLFLVLSYKG